MLLERFAILILEPNMVCVILHLVSCRATEAMPSCSCRACAAPAQQRSSTRTSISWRSCVREKDTRIWRLAQEPSEKGGGRAARRVVPPAGNMCFPCRIAAKKDGFSKKNQLPNGTSTSIVRRAWAVETGEARGGGGGGGHPPQKVPIFAQK
jgi:hypothetical protein